MRPLTPLAQGEGALSGQGQSLAAIAVANGLTLVTRNLRDFASFEDLHCVTWHR